MKTTRRLKDEPRGETLSTWDGQPFDGLSPRLKFEDLSGWGVIF